jgi:hypothetical protein
VKCETPELSVILNIGFECKELTGDAIIENSELINRNTGEFSKKDSLKSIEGRV